MHINTVLEFYIFKNLLVQKPEQNLSIEQIAKDTGVYRTIRATLTFAERTNPVGWTILGALTSGSID